MEFTKVTKQIRKLIPVQYCGAVIVAAGSASRMGGIDKVMAELDGAPMIETTVSKFQECEAIKEIIIVTREDLIAPITSLSKKFDKVRFVVEGGSSRTESVKKGLKMLSDKAKLVAIHDGARPLVTEQLIDRTIRAANTYGAAAPGIPVKDTIKVVQGGIIASTPERSKLQAVQTPQVFDLDLIKGALEKAEKVGAELTDDCSAVEQMGMSVKMVSGDEKNIKVTTPMDLKIAEMLLEDEK